MKPVRFFMQLNAARSKPVPCPERDVEAYFLTVMQLSGVPRTVAEPRMLAGEVIQARDRRCRFWAESPLPRNRDEDPVEWDELCTAQNLEYLLDQTCLLEQLDPAERGAVRRAAELLRKHAVVSVPCANGSVQ